MKAKTQPQPQALQHVYFTADGTIIITTDAAEAMRAWREADAYEDAAAWVDSHRARCWARLSALARAPDPDLVKIVASALATFPAGLSKRALYAKVRALHPTIRDKQRGGRSRRLKALIEEARKVF